MEDVSAPQESVVEQIAADIAPEGEPAIEEIAAIEPAADDPTDVPPTDEVPAVEGETPTLTVEEAVAEVTTADAIRLRAGELLAMVQTLDELSDEDRVARIGEMKVEAALLVPQLIAPVAECDNCRGRIVSAAPAVVHDDTCNTKVAHEITRDEAETALRAKVDALPEEFRQTVLDGKLAEIAKAYECNCSALKVPVRASTSGGSGSRGARVATKRMSAKLTEANLAKGEDFGTTFTISFPEDNETKTWPMPDPAAKTAIKAVLKEAIEWAVEHGAVSPGQTNAVSKAMRGGAGLYKLGG